MTDKFSETIAAVLALTVAVVQDLSFIALEKAISRGCIEFFKLPTAE